MSADLEIFDRLVSHLNYRWLLHKNLFQGASQYDLFNQAGSNVWVALRESLLDAIFMDISRILDPESSCGKDNLSIKRLLPMTTNEKYKTVLDTNEAEARNLYKRLILPWRNQRLSHNDVGTLTGQTGLPDVSFVEIAELIAKIVLCSSDTDREFVPTIMPKAWTQRLFRVLRLGIEQLPPELRIQVAEQDSSSDGDQPRC
jgi:AbiU2